MVGWSEVAAFTEVHKNINQLIFFSSEHQTGRLRTISQYKDPLKQHTLILY